MFVLGHISPMQASNKAKSKKNINVGRAGDLAGGLDDYIYDDAGDADDGEYTLYLNCRCVHTYMRMQLCRNMHFPLPITAKTLFREVILVPHFLGLVGTSGSVSKNLRGVS